MPDDGQHGVADRDDGAFLTPSADPAPVPLAKEGLGAGEPGDDLAEGAAQPRVALAGGAPFFFPAEVVSIGENFAQDTSGAAVGKALMSTPTWFWAAAVAVVATVLGQLGIDTAAARPQSVAEPEPSTELSDAAEPRR